jgi:hypothetical protein
MKQVKTINGKKYIGEWKVYKSIMLPAELQEKIKLLATKKKQTIIQFIEELLKVL